MNEKDLHDESTAESLLCLFLGLLGSALQHTTTKTTCFALPYVFLRPLKLHVVPVCSFVQHDFLNLGVIQDSNRLSVFCCAQFFIKSVIIFDLVEEFKTSFVKLEI